MRPDRFYIIAHDDLREVFVYNSLNKKQNYFQLLL